VAPSSQIAVSNHRPHRNLLVLVMVSVTLTWSAGTSDGNHAMVRRAPDAPVKDLLPSRSPCIQDTGKVHSDAYINTGWRCAAGSVKWPAQSQYVI
jgi:hypothetical protein